MRVCTPAEMRIIEARTGILEEILMESAGAIAAREILLRFWPELKRGRIAIFCGPGNNGADGLVVARHLAAAGVTKITVFPLENPAASKPLFLRQWERISDIQTGDVSNLQDFASYSLIVDALYGIGLDRPLQGEKIERLIAQINSSRKPVVSLDTPSGLDCEKGVGEGAVVRASITLTFTAPKLGFFTAEGAVLCGILRVLPIGFPLKAVSQNARNYRLFTERGARKLLPRRDLSSNKSSFGHLVVCAGRPGFWGAGILAAQAAFRVGSGYVTWASQTAPLSELKFHPEVMTSALMDLFSEPKKYSAFVVGPGLGVEEHTRKLIQQLASMPLPVVLDADALSVLAKEKNVSLPPGWILTPHAGELSRLLGISVEAIERDRFSAAQTAARKFGCLVLLKGFRTVIASPSKCVIIYSGGPALAKAGTGDVLAGFIGGFLAQGMSSLKAAALGAYLHGRLADEWVRNGKDVSSLVASDLATGLPELMRALRSPGNRLQGDSL